MKQLSSCFLENRGKGRFVRIKGYSPLPANRLEVRASLTPEERIPVGEHFCKERGEFEVEYLLPSAPRPGLVRVELAFDRTFRPEKRDDKRELSAMIFEVGLAERAAR